MITRLLTSNRLRFGAAHGTRSLGWAAVDLLLAWHLHVRVGLTGVETGWLLCLFLTLGGGATALAGYAFSRCHAADATVVRVQVPATFVTAIMLLAQFSVSGTVAAVATGVAFRLSYAVQDVAQNMLAALLPPDDAEARRYARLRVTLSAATRCLIVGGFATATSAGMADLLAVVGALMIVASLGLRNVTFPARAPIRPALRHDRPVPSGLPSLLLRWVMATTFLPTVTRLLIFAPSPANAWGTGAVLLGSYCLGTMLGPALRRSLGRSAVLTIVVASGTILSLPPVLGTAARVAAAVLHGVGLSVITVQLWAATSRMAMDEARTGRRQDGTIFGTVILTLHLATAISMAMLGPLIDQLDTARSHAPAVGLLLTTIGVLAIAGSGTWPRSSSRRTIGLAPAMIRRKSRPATLPMA